MNFLLPLFLKIKTSQVTILSINILVLGSMQLCFADEQTYDGSYMLESAYPSGNGWFTLIGASWPDLTSPTDQPQSNIVGNGYYKHIDGSFYRHSYIGNGNAIYSGAYGSTCEQMGYPTYRRWHSGGGSTIYYYKCQNVTPPSSFGTQVYAVQSAVLVAPSLMPIPFDPAKFSPAIPLNNEHGISKYDRAVTSKK